MKRLIIVLMVMLLPAGPLWAVKPDEMLQDPVLEARARDISQGLRCLVCRNENIDESNADLARDLRLLVRERIVAGDNDEQVVAFIVERYGEYVLLRPTLSGWNWLLWASAPLLALMALGIALIYLRGRSAASGEFEAALSVEEQERMRQIMDE
jgi:cytochrome c-type biogenesis protein CcmH